MIDFYDMRGVRGIHKHAYLIIAHNEFEILEKLILMLDDQRNDIYLHIDNKVKNFDFPKFFALPLKSRIYFVSRQNVNWGSFSQIECELRLLESAHKGNYNYYHLLSGVDLPLKTQDEIHNFFISRQGTEFIHFSKDFDDEIINRVRLFHIFQDAMGLSRNKVIKLIIKSINKSFIFVQKILGVNRLKMNEFKLKYGSQWFSITHDFAAFMLDSKKWINKYFKYSFCGDELFVQTLAYNSRFRSRLSGEVSKNSYLCCRRYIDWERGNPFIWRTADFNQLINSDYMFARKFSGSIDVNIVEKIYFYLDQQKNRL
mgnify:CR=1 FL=1